jgi:hypothetical protein
MREIIANKPLAAKKLVFYPKSGSESYDKTYYAGERCVCSLRVDCAVILV